MSRSVILIAALGIVCALAGLRAMPANAAAPPDFFGVAPQAPLDERDFELMAKDDVGIMRAVFWWPSVELEPGGYYWGEIDGVVADAAAAGVRVFPVLYGTPRWAISKDRFRRCGIACGPDGHAREAFARFAEAAVARYGPDGEFWSGTAAPPAPPPPSSPEPPPCGLPICATLPATSRGAAQPRQGDPVPYVPINAWQIWNEPNSPKYFGPRPRVRSYARLLKTTADRITAVDPSADVVVGGMWGPRGTTAVIPTERYLTALYGVPGVRRAVDSIAVHPYAGELRQVKAQLRGIRVVAERAGDRGAGLWVTELGWASGGPRSQPLVKTPREQASLLRRSFRFLLRRRLAWHVRAVFWYSWRDTRATAGICEWCARSGLRAVGGAPKPAARAFRRIAG